MANDKDRNNSTIVELMEKFPDWDWDYWTSQQQECDKMFVYDNTVVNALVSEGFSIGWEEVRPLLIMMIFCLGLGLFALGQMMREWAWLRQWDHDEDDYDHDIEIVSSQQGGKTLNCVAYLKWGCRFESTTKEGEID